MAHRSTRAPVVRGLNTGRNSAARPQFCALRKHAPIET